MTNKDVVAELNQHIALKKKEFPKELGTPDQLVVTVWTFSFMSQKIDWLISRVNELELAVLQLEAYIEDKQRRT